jgi:predicted signal transduction protein with EAL and GGDEF domain
VPGVSTVAEAQAIGDRVVRDLRAVTDLSGSEVEVRASAGVALLPLHARDGEDLLRFADTALYRAKSEGKGRCAVYDPGMTATELARAQTVRELQAGIAADDLFLVYQPKYHLATGTLTGYEALVRWLHPKRGVVFPNDFIGLAEQSGLIHDLGAWVLRRAVRQVREWADEGRGWHHVAVNMSSLQLRDGQFVNLVMRALAEFKVPGHCLQIELTESCIAENRELARSLVKELRRLGASVAVDDFGTGFSSLSMLSEFDIDCLKVDRSFVDAIHTPSGEAICRAVINLGHGLGMRIVAEGVETLAQAKALAGLNCNEVQGYYFAKPQPVEKAIKLLRVDAVLPGDEDDDDVRVPEIASSVVIPFQDSKRSRLLA